MTGGNLRRNLLSVGTVAFLALGGLQGNSATSRLFDLVPAAVRSWLHPAPSPRKGPGAPPTKCGITIDPNGCPPPPSCAGCGG